jgi:L-asparaginase/beta-aspartyl-peptidase (threonine type)
MRVIVHGGAGTSPDEPEPRQATLDEAADAGAAESDPVDAVEAAVRVLEADTGFNAGTGGAVQSDGVVRTDAGVMTSEAGDGRGESPTDGAGSAATREAGAAASMPGVEAAVSVARAVMEETPHVFLNGVHAVDFAADVGVDVECDLWSEDTWERWDDLENHPEGGPLAHRDWIRDKFGARVAERSESTERASGEAASTDPGGQERSGEGGGDGYEKDHDTVGAVAFDGETFAAATSTGGRWLALAGRVGDVPQVGSGFYAAPAGAASATGAGEDIAKTTLTRRAVRHLEHGMGAQAAADRAIEEFNELAGSSAGVIVLDTDGECGEAFNSEAMQTARR